MTTKQQQRTGALGDTMSAKRLGWVLLAFLLLSFSAKADTVNVYFNGGYAYSDHGYEMPAYQGTVNGQSASLFCVDFSHEIYPNTGWQATVTQLGTSNYSATRLNNGTEYMEIAWLLDQSLLTNSNTSKAEFQWAVWSLSGGPNPYGTNSVLLTQASNAVKNGFSDTSWEILTPTGRYGQEFFVRTPEPSTLIMLGSGLIGLIGFGRRKLSS
jgi:hypothetical protein